VDRRSDNATSESIHAACVAGAKNHELIAPTILLPLFSKRGRKEGRGGGEAPRPRGALLSLPASSAGLHRAVLGRDLGALPSSPCGFEGNDGKLTVTSTRGPSGLRATPMLAAACHPVLFASVASSCLCLLALTGRAKSGI